MARYTIDLGNKLEGILEEMAGTSDATKAEIIRKALAMYIYMNKNVKDGQSIAILDENKNIVREVVFI